MNKELSGWIVAGVILIGVILFFSFNYVSNKYYQVGYNDGVFYTAQSQTQTGNILIVDNNTIQSIHINQICGGE